MKNKPFNKVRTLITREAARLMVEEDVKQFYVAKRMAASRLSGSQARRHAPFRARDLPSNGEIHAAMLELVCLTDGHLHSRRLFAMRVVALQIMQALVGFEPRLIGSVATGHVRRGSDIDLHVFTDHLEELEGRLFELGWTYELNTVSIRKGNAFRDYVHVYVDHVFPVELSVYDWRERRVVTRSSTDGQPMRRLKTGQVGQLLLDEHGEEWEEYGRKGEIPDLELVSEPAALAEAPEEGVEEDEADEDFGWLELAL